MTAREQIQRRATEIYLSSRGTLEQAYEQAKREILKNDIPQEVKDLFGGIIR